MVAFLHRFLLGQVLALLSLAVPAGTFFVVNMGLSIHPDQAGFGAGSLNARGRRGVLFCG
jgi:hypothetical protein